jgi:hypothetical protein
VQRAGGENQLMREPSDKGKIRLLVSWCALLVLGYISATITMADVLHDQKVSAITRHLLRLDPHKVEAGRTALETQKFDLGREPKYQGQDRDIRGPDFRRGAAAHSLEG